MYKFEYVTKKEWQPIRNNLLKLMEKVRLDIKGKLSVQFKFIGSSSRNMITCDKSTNIGFDFDVNIRIIKNKADLSPKEIKNTIKTALDRFSAEFEYDNAEDSKRVLTIKVKDLKNSKILHSCDFAVVRINKDGKEEYIHHNKTNNTYSWNLQPEVNDEVQKKSKQLKDKHLWIKVRERYLNKKNINKDLNKKSRHLYSETITEIYKENFK